MRQLPHLLTLLRLFASPWLTWLLLRGQFREALAIVLLAGLTDWFDGWTARRLHVSGKLGTVLDPLADKVLLVTLFVALGWVRLVPAWLVILTIGRDVVIVIGALLLRAFRGKQRFVPSTLGKVSTFFQIMLVLHVLLYISFPNEFFLWLQYTAFALSAFFTSFSGLAYVRLGIQRARRPAAVQH